MAKITIHVQTDRYNQYESLLHVDREAKTVHVQLPDGSLRYAGNDVETVGALPLYQPEPIDVAVVEAPVPELNVGQQKIKKAKEPKVEQALAPEAVETPIELPLEFGTERTPGEDTTPQA